MGSKSAGVINPCLLVAINFVLSCWGVLRMVFFCLLSYSVGRDEVEADMGTDAPLLPLGGVNVGVEGSASRRETKGEEGAEEFVRMEGSGDAMGIEGMGVLPSKLIINK
jgi:hypothetical protein